MRWTPRRIHALALVLIFLVIALPFVFWWYDSFRSTIPQGPFIARYYTVESGGGGPGDTLTVKPRIPAGVIGSRTSGPNLSGTSFRFPPIGEDLDRTTKIGTVQVNFLFLTATDANVTLSISYPEGTATLVTRVFPGASSGAQSNLLPYMADFENNKSLPTIILQPNQQAGVSLVSDSSVMTIGTDSAVWLTVQVAPIPPPDNVWSYEKDPLLTTLSVFLAFLLGDSIKRSRSEAISQNKVKDCPPKEGKSEMPERLSLLSQPAEIARRCSQRKPRHCSTSVRMMRPTTL